VGVRGAPLDRTEKCACHNDHAELALPGGRRATPVDVAAARLGFVYAVTRSLWCLGDCAKLVDFFNDEAQMKTIGH
jgi:hypothetical protein